MTSLVTSPRYAGWLVALALAACGPREYRVLGYIDFSDSSVKEPEIPERIAVGVPVEIVLWTFGGGCTRAGDTEVVVDGRIAVLTPYDIEVEHRNSVCTDIFVFLEHRATVVFSEPGMGQIELRYRGPRGDDHRVYAVEISPAQ